MIITKMGVLAAAALLSLSASAQLTVIGSPTTTTTTLNRGLTITPYTSPYTTTPRTSINVNLPGAVPTVPAVPVVSDEPKPVAPIPPNQGGVIPDTLYSAQPVTPSPTAVPISVAPITTTTAIDRTDRFANPCLDGTKVSSNCAGGTAGKQPTAQPVTPSPVGAPVSTPTSRVPSTATGTTNVPAGYQNICAATTVGGTNCLVPVNPTSPPIDLEVTAPPKVTPGYTAICIQLATGGCAWKVEPTTTIRSLAPNGPVRDPVVIVGAPLPIAQPVTPSPVSMPASPVRPCKGDIVACNNVPPAPVESAQPDPIVDTYTPSAVQ